MANVSLQNASGLSCPIEVLKQVAKSNDFHLIDTTGFACKPGSNVFVGGTGLTATLPAPKPGQKVVLQLRSITSGAVVVTTASGTTFDGTNNTATLAQAGDICELVYKSATTWGIVYNTGVALSAV